MSGLRVSVEELGEDVQNMSRNEARRDTESRRRRKEHTGVEVKARANKEDFRRPILKTSWATKNEGLVVAVFIPVGDGKERIAEIFSKSGPKYPPGLDAQGRDRDWG